LLQEVDRYTDIEEHLKSRNFLGTLAMKPDGVMGCAIFWRKDLFELRSPAVIRNFIEPESGKAY
jgi:hypothetical protein